MTSVFVYEDVCATGAGGDDKSPPAPSLLAEGQAMLSAVTDDFRSVRGVRLHCLGEPGASATGGAAPVADAPGSPGFSHLAQRADYTLVIAPECAGRLQHLCREVLRVGGQLLGPSPDAVGLTADKLTLARHWYRFDVPTPRTWPLGEEPPALTVVVKPRDGAGSQATIQTVGTDVQVCPVSFGQTWRSVPTAVGWPGPMIALEYVPGFAASVAFLVGPRALTPLVPCAQRLSADGRFAYRGGSLPIAADLAARAERIALAAVRCIPGLLGYVGVDVVLGDDGRDWAIEINPRLTTSYVGLRALARFNLAGAMLAAVRGEPLPALSWDDGRVEFTPDGAVTRIPIPTARANT